MRLTLAAFLASYDSSRHSFLPQLLQIISTIPFGVSILMFLLSLLVVVKLLQMLALVCLRHLQFFRYR